jgi:hypothetical protein
MAGQMPEPGSAPGELLNSYSKAADKTEFDITTAERSNPFAALYNGIKLYLHKDACCSCGEASVPNVVFSWETGTKSGVPFIAIGIIDGAGYTTDQIVNVGYLVQDQSGNEVWTGFVFDPDNTIATVLDTTNLVASDEWTITFSVSGVKTDLGCTPKLVYSVTIEAVSGDSGSTEYFLNRNATPWDAKITDLDISAAVADVNAFTFKITAITAIPAGTVIPLLAYGIPNTNTIKYTSISGVGVTISGASVVVGTALAAGATRTVTGEFENPIPVTGTATIKIIDPTESNNTTSDTYA